MYDWAFMSFGEPCGDDIARVVLKWGGTVEKTGQNIKPRGTQRRGSVSLCCFICFVRLW